MFSNKLQLRQHGRAQKKGFYNQNLPVMEQTLASRQQLAPALWHKLLCIMVPVTTKHSDSTIHPPRPREEFVPAPENRTRAERQTGTAGVGGSGEVRRSENRKKMGNCSCSQAWDGEEIVPEGTVQKTKPKQPQKSYCHFGTAINCMAQGWAQRRFLIHRTNTENTQN